MEIGKVVEKANVEALFAIFPQLECVRSETNLRNLIAKAIQVYKSRKLMRGAYKEHILQIVRYLTKTNVPY